MALNITRTLREYALHVADFKKKGSRHYEEDGVTVAGKMLRKALKENKTDREFSIQENFIEAFGYEEFRHCKATNEVNMRRLREAAGGVSTAAFLNIQGQYFYTTFMEAYEDPEFVFTKLIPKRNGRIPGTEKIPGIQRMGNETTVVAEGKDYPLIGTGEDWINFSEPDKKGGIVPITKEAIFYDLTGLLVSRCSEVGRIYGVQLEIAAVDCVIDENVTSHRHNWKGTEIATYGNNSGSHTWDNLEASNALTDWATLNKPYLLLRQMTDPYTGLPCMYNPKHLVVDSTLEMQAIGVIAAPYTRQHVGGYATSGNLNQQEFPNPFAKYGIQVIASNYVGYRMATDTNWFLGDLTKAFVRNEHFPMDVTQAPANSERDFMADIVAQYKVSGKMKYETPQPRAMTKNTA